MGTTLALLTVLSVVPAQAGLTLTHVRATHGLLGPERGNDTLAPGDIYFLCFDIEGVNVEDDGKVRYEMATEARDPSGKVVFRQDPKSLSVTVSLGGNSVPAYARLDVGLDTPPGDYQYKVTVKDPSSGKQQSLTRTITVLPRRFALVRETVSLDTQGAYPAAVLACGQGVWVQCSAVDFARDRTSKQPNLVFEVRVLDGSGKPTLAKPMIHKINKDIPEAEQKVPLAFPLSLNRPGKFTIEILASDENSGKKAKSTTNITVVPGRKE